jgi:hypothetical protein
VHVNLASQALARLVVVMSMSRNVFMIRDTDCDARILKEECALLLWLSKRRLGSDVSGETPLHNASVSVRPTDGHPYHWRGVNRLAASRQR